MCVCRIKSLDLVCMKELDKKVGSIVAPELLCSLFRWSPSQVNIIPVIAKADTIARSELPQFKARVRENIHHFATRHPALSCPDYRGASSQWSPDLPVPNRR